MRTELIEALIGVAKVISRGDPAAKDDLSPAILILAELIASISMVEVGAPESRIEQRARRLAEIENSLVNDIERGERAKIVRKRLGLSKSGYYRDRATAKKMRMLEG